eukprot:3637406-Rhodomonas_salina.2
MDRIAGSDANGGHAGASVMKEASDASKYSNWMGGAGSGYQYDDDDDDDDVEGKQKGDAAARVGGAKEGVKRAVSKEESSFSMGEGAMEGMGWAALGELGEGLRWLSVRVEHAKSLPGTLLLYLPLTCYPISSIRLSVLRQHVFVAAYARSTACLVLSRANGTTRLVQKRGGPAVHHAPVRYAGALGCWY